MSGEKREGACKWFNNAKGFGFLINPEGVDVFVHFRDIQKPGYKTLAEGEKVFYLETSGDKGLSAKEVTPC